MMTAKKHWNTGNKHAQKGPHPADVNLNIRVTYKERETWRKKAKAAGLKLSEWVRRRLNE